MASDQSSKVGPIVSAAHLAKGEMPELSEVEFALTLMNHAFQRWMVHCMGASGVPGLQPVAVQILHAIAHRDREKTLSELCMMFNIEDTHIVIYAIKRLTAMGLVESRRRGKEKAVLATTEGKEVCRRYHEVREALLITGMKRLKLDNAALSGMAETMRTISGQYDQAARTATSL